MTGRNIDALFAVNMKRLALLTLPTWLRRPLAGALVYAGVAPLGRLLQELRTYRISTRYRLRHNGQVCKLRGVLNDLFDEEQRRIRILDADDPGAMSGERVWPRSEGRWVMTPVRASGSAVRLHRRGFGGSGGYDFLVSVPAELRVGATEARLRAVVNMYKLASMRFAVTFR